MISVTLMKKIRFTTGIPPLILIGTIIVLFPIFAFMTIDRINKQKSQSIKLLVEKSTALIRAFEAGTYSGMMSFQWANTAMENLLTETAALPDIVYLFIVDKNGMILAHNQQEKSGLIYGQDLDLKSIIRENKIGWRIISSQTGEKVFEVHKKFSPINQNQISNIKTLPQRHQHMHAKAFQNANEYENTMIFVGVDMELIASANKGDTQHAIIMAVILALIGFTGFMLVFIVQRYTQTRSSLSRMQIFSDNLVENMPLGLIATDINNQIISINPAASLILGINLESPIQRGNIVLPVEINHFLHSVCEHETLQEKEIELKDNTSSTAIMLEVFASPLRDKEGQFLGTLLILRDKTELHRLKAEMEQNKRLAAIGRLAAGVAHEIRNPLSSLKGYAVFFKEVFDHDSENFTIADTMTKEVDRLDRVISELVELAKPVAVSGNPVNIQEFVLETSQLISYEPDAKNIDLKTRFEPDLPMIHADADRLKQVLLNLYLNAIQAMDGTGTLDVAVQKTSDNSGLTICVSDTGKGMTQEELASIFEPYFTTKLSGTGLGLSIVHNIIQAHKGKIRADSKPGEGTVFTITLPVGTN